MSDTGDTFRALDRHKRAIRARYGVECPECKRQLPRANPKILLPGQLCTRVGHRYTDPRPELTEEQHQEIEDE